ncbi:hypothetical protein [Parasphingorhabdus halotolerans]|uniref:Uncharacterized protein n=1 Tax=Parasphingorhabdus halotolerans TaxID=2725558 RepID=A0A6H2DQT3_9SPHN|nr:hypothetical protein [Parasphingorhabdus halotolerans]QJB70487.1 hypothetical protein HF685_15480 [Parasphingorhabdus halotolerans]
MKMEKIVIYKVNVTLSLLCHLGVFIFIFVYGYTVEGIDIFKLSFFADSRFFFGNYILAFIAVYCTFIYMLVKFSISVFHRKSFLYLEGNNIYLKGKKISSIEQIDTLKTRFSYRYLFRILDIYLLNGKKLSSLSLCLKK